MHPHSGLAYLKVQQIKFGYLLLSYLILALTAPRLAPFVHPAAELFANTFQSLSLRSCRGWQPPLGPVHIFEVHLRAHCPNESLAASRTLPASAAASDMGPIRTQVRLMPTDTYYNCYKLGVF